MILTEDTSLAGFVPLMTAPENFIRVRLPADKVRTITVCLVSCFMLTHDVYFILSGTGKKCLEGEQVAVLWRLSVRS